MKIRYYLSLSAAVVILAGSFFLPNAVAGVTDMRRLDNLAMIDSDRISFEASPDLSLLERIALAANSNTEKLPLKTGNAMDVEAAKERALQELERFYSRDAFRFEFSEHIVEESTASLVIDTMEPALNMIVWELILVDPSENVLTVTIDDETGVILRLVHRLVNADQQIAASALDDELHMTAQMLADMMTAYYGLTVELGDYLFSGHLSYYRADISDRRGLIIPMYGVVRASSFTMNERV